jgi:head-tail adaptor
VKEVFRPRRQRITIQQKIARQNCVGEVQYEWQQVCTVWAEFKGGGVVTVRYREDLSVGDRALIGDAYFEIINVVDRRETRLIELSIRPYERERESVPRFRNEEQS